MALAETSQAIGSVAYRTIRCPHLRRHSFFQKSPNNRDTLVSRRAASIRAHWATSSSRVTVTLRKRFKDDTELV